MDIYNYHSVTGEYLSTETAELDQLESTPIVPMYATLTSVIAVAAGSVAVFDGTIWTEIEDHRGTVYDTNTTIATQHISLGPLPANLTSEIHIADTAWNGVAWIFNVSNAQITKNIEISALFEQATTLGFVTNAIKMDALTNNILQLDAGVRLAERLSQTNMVIRDYDNVVRTLLTTEVSTMVEELGTNYQTLLQNKWTLQDQVNLATNQTELDAIVWT